METLTVPVYNSEGKEVETIKLDAAVFGIDVNESVIHQAISAYRANQRLGLAATKTRGEVSGGGKKPWRQKGTGRARVGSTRSPLWRHGGVVFGPHPRNFSVRLSNTIKDRALQSVLCAKVKENNLMVLDSLSLGDHKTKNAVKILSNLKLTARKTKQDSVLFLLDAVNPTTKRALRNIGFLDFNLAKDTHTYEVLSHKKLLITKDGLKILTQRLKQ